MVEVPVTPMSIIASINDAPAEPGWKGRRDAEGPQTVPEPPDRPDEHAQWDEAHGQWIVWDATAEAWVPVTEPPAAAPDDDTSA